jgi:2-isopropylmalate synthase
MATSEIEVDGERRSASAGGNGPLDAALKPCDAALGLDVELLDLTNRAVTGGRDALAEFVVRVRHAGNEAAA